jgi:hypothetical protein
MSHEVTLPASVEGVVEVTVHRPAVASRRWVLIEVPHGATRKEDYDRVFARLEGPLPAQLEHFFFVNTDIGAPEGAAWLGRTLSGQDLNVVVARCLMPRTFIDTNRVVAPSEGGVVKDGMTPGVAAYVTSPRDIAWLTAQHQRYHQVVDRLYQEVCRKGDGLALQLHSYSPRSVGIEKVDANIVEALHAAYLPEVYGQWPERPAVDLICETADGSFQVAPRLHDALRAAYAADGIEAKKNGTYHQHPVTMGYAYAAEYPQQVLCVELNRGLVADPFVPFGVSPISEEKVARMVAPIGRVLAAALG